ncbi:Serine/threonine-protein phosphatase 2A 56 kDa regulatory subunit delta isoform [Paragonimus kellicotti]|nr:Serine/threonine-protein phosphatase 2A 56 kDa regulatory subunit delta isoform [Paragonimus kellicotti]
MLSGSPLSSPTSQLSSPTPVSTSEDKGHTSPAVVNNINSRLHGGVNSEAHPPPTQLFKINSVAGPPVVRKEKQLTSSRFNVGKNRELTPLPLIKGSLFLLSVWTITVK